MPALPKKGADAPKLSPKKPPNIGPNTRPIAITPFRIPNVLPWFLGSLQLAISTLPDTVTLELTKPNMKRTNPSIAMEVLKPCNAVKIAHKNNDHLNIKVGRLF